MSKVFAICLITFSIIFPAKYPYKIITNELGEPLALSFKWDTGKRVAMALKDYELLKESDEIYSRQADTITNLLGTYDRLKTEYRAHNKRTKIKSFLRGVGVGGGIVSIIVISVKIILIFN